MGSSYFRQKWIGRYLKFEGKGRSDDLGHFGIYGSDTNKVINNYITAVVSVDLQFLNS